MNDPAPTPTTPGLYLDAVGEVWRVRAAGAPCRSVSFDELLEQALEQPAALAARSGPFTPLLALPVHAQNLLLDALGALRYELDEGVEWNRLDPNYLDSRRRAIGRLVHDIEALG